MKKVLIAIGKALCFALLFLFAQSFVVFLASAVFTFRLALQSYGPLGVVPPYEEMMNATLAFIESYGTLLSALGDLLALLAAWAIFRLQKKRLCAETGLRGTSPRNVLFSALCGLVFAIAVCLAISILPIPDTVMQAYEEVSAETLKINSPLMLLAIVFVAPFVEEVYFRGLVYSRLKEGLPYWLAMLLGSLLFGLIHGQILWIAYAFCAGLLMCCVTEKSGSLWAGVAFHCAFNFSGSYIVSFIPDMELPLAALLCLALAFIGFVLIRRIDGKFPPLRKQREDQCDDHTDVS